MILPFLVFFRLKKKKKSVSGYMEFQNETVIVGFFLFCSKFIHGNNRETVCMNGEISRNPLKTKRKVRVSGEKLG